MDEFEVDRLELSTDLISMEFDSAGRIHQIWLTDPALPEEGEELQFVCPPVVFGEDTVENYLPGTILVGARTDPEEPWVLSRSSQAQKLEEFRVGALPGVGFEYRLGLLEDIEAIGRFSESIMPIQEIVWTITLKNRGRVSIEIGELGFPMPFNTIYDGFGWSDEQLSKLWNSRIVVHKSISGASSWLTAHRLNSEPPGLLVYPGAGTQWEFYAHVPSSLNTPYQWEGIPVVYALSKAIIEREGWPDWHNEHSSLILEPGDERTFQIRFAPTDADKIDAGHHALTLNEYPIASLFPGPVVPIDTGVRIDLRNLGDKKGLTSDRAVDQNSVALDPTASYILKGKETGVAKISFQDASDRTSFLHLCFIEPIQKLISARARYIVETQLVKEGPMESNFALTEIGEGQQQTSEEVYSEPAGLEGSLADALFLAEKNAIHPVADEIEALHNFHTEFLDRRVQNPASFAVASTLDQNWMGRNFGRPTNYPLVANFYASMARIAERYHALPHNAAHYRQLAVHTIQALLENGWRNYVYNVGIIGMPHIFDLADELTAAGDAALAEELEGVLMDRASKLADLDSPFAGESVMDTSGLADIISCYEATGSDEQLERALKCLMALKGLSTSWWWNGSDKRFWDGADATPKDAILDRGEMALSYPSVATSAAFIRLLDREQIALPEVYLQKSFGGLLGVWALVQESGAASLCYVPDSASRSRGFSRLTGSIGIGLFEYLRAAGSHVLSQKGLPERAYLCSYSTSESQYELEPWDGVGQRVVMSNVGVSASLSGASIAKMSVSTDRRRAEIMVRNSSAFAASCRLSVKGLWGQAATVSNKKLKLESGRFNVRFKLPAGGEHLVKIEVVH